MPDFTVEMGPGVNQRFQEVAPGEHAREVYTRDLWSAGVALGRAYIATSDRITTDATKTHIVGLIRNPAGSGKLVTIAQVVANIGPDAMTLGTVMLNPTTGLPTAAHTPFNVKALAGGTEPAAGEFLVNAAGAALGGGTATELRLTTHKGRNDLPIGLPLAPGTSLGVSIPLGLVAAGDGTFAVYLIEEPL